MKMDFQWNKSPDQICKDMVGGEGVIKTFANEAKKRMLPYVPANNLVLAEKNVRVYTENGKGIVHYLSPYARFQFEGKVMVGRESHSPWAHYGEHKVVTSQNIDYNTFRHPLATSHWDKAMMTARKEDIARAVQNYIRKKG